MTNIVVSSFDMKMGKTLTAGGLPTLKALGWSPPAFLFAEVQYRDMAKEGFCKLEVQYSSDGLCGLEFSI